LLSRGTVEGIYRNQGCYWPPVSRDYGRLPSLGSRQEVRQLVARFLGTFSRDAAHGKPYSAVRFL